MAARSFPDDESKRAPATPGVVWLAHCVNLVAACTLWLFYLVPVPVVWDPITHCRVHMLRWCEWTVLSFVMTFMTEVGDRSNPWSAVRLAAMGALSTSCGFLLPLARGSAAWVALIGLSFTACSSPGSGGGARRASRRRRSATTRATRCSMLTP
mmetsp:Transcript_6952/g.24509  ORF Transcript_6952/g.24509 Transcript_6952/m.24509 type:complete len:154 (+) Transcript_6952:420-881(+)